MQATIYKVIQALNEVEVKGEQNHNMLLYAIQQLKQLQNDLIKKVEAAAHEQPDN